MQLWTWCSTLPKLKKHDSKPPGRSKAEDGRGVRNVQVKKVSVSVSHDQKQKATDMYSGTDNSQQTRGCGQ